MAFESSPEQPAPVRTVSRMVGEWIGRLGAVWMDGQIAELRPRPGARNIYLVLRDPDVDMSLTLVADAAWLLLEQALLIEGVPLENPGLFVQRLNRVLNKAV